MVSFLGLLRSEGGNFHEVEHAARVEGGGPATPLRFQPMGRCARESFRTRMRTEQVGAIDPNRPGGSGEPPLPPKAEPGDASRTERMFGNHSAQKMRTEQVGTIDPNRPGGWVIRPLPRLDRSAIALRPRRRNTC